MIGVALLILSFYPGFLATLLLKNLTMLERSLLGIIIGFLAASGWPSWHIFLSETWLQPSD